MSEEKNPESKQIDELPKIRWLIYSIAGVLIILAAIRLIVPWISPETDMQGQFGNMFGAANALFSGLAFVIIILTLRIKSGGEISEDDSPSPGWMLLAAVVVIAVLLVFWISVTNLISDPAQQGQFGDMFGAANTLFSGLAFAGIIYTIWLQRTELKLQRKTLNKTQEELKLSREAHELATKIMTSQLETSMNLSKLENARYRKEVLPFIVLRYSDNNSKKESEGKIKLTIHLRNVGQKINKVTFTQLRDGTSDKSIDHIGEQDEFFIFAFCSTNTENSTQFFDMSFSTMDGVLWDTKLSFHVVNYEVKTLFFGNPIEVKEL
ncbi:MAG: hypothetical protein ACIAZJ_26160 [Gimesia chilikensis]|uniref:hypothetical protein n=1 Tax=Gimesia chilikensis TaxID=2605989 RepID=UPI00379478DC